MDEGGAVRVTGAVPAREAVRVNILGEPFAIRSEADPEYTHQVAAHVDSTLRALRQQGGSMEPFPTAVLGAMEITDDLFRTRSDRAALIEEAIARIDRTIGAIDATLNRETSLTEDETR